MPTTDDLPMDYCSPRAFHEQFPALHKSIDALRWELRFRHENGMIDDGVVIERLADPSARRPALLISPTRYIARLKKLSRMAAA